MTEKTLLPIGAVINHDGHDLKIIRILKSGWTGEVYEGALSLVENKTPARVAVKVMKTLEFPMARQLFLQESETLAFLMHLEEEASKEQRVMLKVAPVYYGRGEYEGTPYLVMEFIAGQEVPELLVKGGHFEEKQALVIAWHLYRTLDILHTRLKRTYIDLKFEDLWWVSGTTEWNGQLKVTDFGTLEDIRPTDTQQRGVQRDLLLGGVYLFAMLTGDTLNYSIGELRERAEPVIQKHEEEISWGTRKLLRRLLHRNPASRPISAAAVASDLRTLVNFWSQPEEKLLSMAQKNLAEAETAVETAKTTSQPIGQQGRDYAIRARSALDILHIRSPQKDLDNEIKRAESALFVGDYLERGTALLIGHSYGMARQVFEEGIQWSDEPAVLRRWAFLAQVGEEIPPATFDAQYDEVVKALDSLNKSHLEMAKTRLGELTALASKGLDHLKNETELFILLEQAEDARGSDEFEKAAKIYKQALEILKQLPESDAMFIRNEEIGDLSLFVEEMKLLAVTREKSRKLFAESLREVQKGDFDRAANHAWEAYMSDRGAPTRSDALNDIARKLLDYALKEKDKFSAAVVCARSVAGIGTWESPMDPVLYITWQLARSIDDGERAAALRDGAGFSRAMERGYAEAAKDSLLQPISNFLIERSAGRAVECGDFVFLRVTADLAERFLGDNASASAWRIKADELEKKLSEEQHVEVDRRLESIHFILAPISPLPGNLAKILSQASEAASVWRGLDLTLLRDRLRRLEEAEWRLAEACSLIGRSQYRAEEVNSLQETVTQGLTEARKAITGQEKADSELLQQRITALSFERMQIDTLRQWFKRAPENDDSQEAKRLFHRQLREKLSEFIYRCYLILAGHKESDREAIVREQTLKDYGKAVEKMDDLGSVKVLIEWGNHALDELGAEAWQEVQKVAEEHQHQIVTNFEPAEAAFKSGDMTRLAAELDHMESTHNTNVQWQTLKKGLVQVSIWKTWLEVQTDRFKQGQPDLPLLKDLRDYLHSDLPGLFWQQSPVPAYLKKANDTARQNTGQALKRNDEQAIIEKLREWLSVVWTTNLTAQALPGKRESKWNSVQWLREIYRAGLNINQINTLVTNTPVPEDIETALNSFSATDWQAIKQSEQKHKQQTARIKRALIIIPIILTFLALLFTGGYFVYRAKSAVFQQVLQRVISLVISPTPIETPPTATATEPPTATATEPPTAIPTITPTTAPNQPSKFLVDVAGLYPVLPIAGDSAWVLNERDATVAPQLDDTGVWKKGNSTDTGANEEDYYYTTVGNATVTWEMDQPFETGLYQIYVLDTKTNSAGPYQFNMLLDGSPATIYKGGNAVIFQDTGQKADDWLALGAYQIQSGQKLSIRLDIGPLDKTKPFAIDRLLIIKVSDTQKNILDGLPAGRTLVSLLDDSRASFYELVEGKPVLVKDRGVQIPDALAWDGSFNSRNLATPYVTTIWVDWQPLGRLPAGTYELLVWVPKTNATVHATYDLLADGELVPRDNPAPLDQSAYHGEWVSLGTWKMDTEAAVGVRMVIEKGISGEIGVDAVAIVRVGE